MSVVDIGEPPPHTLSSPLSVEQSPSHMRWCHEWPHHFNGAVAQHEVLDAKPVMSHAEA